MFNASSQLSEPRPERGVFLLLGPSGSGKGSVGEALLGSRLVSAHASMGGWLREAIDEPESLEARLLPLQPEGFASPMAYLRHCVTGGLLIPDAWTEAVIERQLERVPDGLWLLDGYPRTVAAARHLRTALDARGVPLLGALELQIPFSVMRQRLLARGRSDDTEAAIERRLEFYEASVRPTLDWLEAQGVMVQRVNADRALPAVVEDVKNRLGANAQRRSLTAQV